MRIRFIIVIVCSLMVGSCAGGSPTDPTVAPPTVSETFTGTLSPQEVESHNFTVTSAGAVSVTLTSAGPPSTITIGIGVGTPITTDPGCAVISGVATNAGTTAQLNGTATAGALCLAVFDVGNLSADIDYSVTVVHP